MHSTRGRLTGALLVAAATVALIAGAPPRPPSDLRVCADPYDMPFSNNQEEGFENKIAHVVARDLNATVINYWWPSRRGVLRNSILGGFCDVMIQAPVGFDPVATTQPYYRSTYYFVYRADRRFTLRSLDDTILKRLKIGVNMIGYDYTNTPPAHALGSRGIVGLVGFGNFLNPDPKADHPDDIINAVAKDSIDVAIVWGPLAGYWVKRQSVPLTMVALPDTDAVSGMPFAFSMAMAVRHRDKALKATLDSVIDRRRGEITEILRQYNVPMIELRAAAAPAPPARDTVRDSLLVSDSVYQGWKWFAVYCFRCHGEDAMHPILPTAPDLRWAVSPTGANFPRDSFVNTALNGRLDKGMPAWKVLLDTTAIQELYVYVKARSDGWLKPGRPHRLSDLPQKTKSP
ncbi:MAG TPA: quinoprotein dehydrogenase-associated putative ABC transporter substrate-binding protein [Gemmatimonadales bacterium]|nr:quinoprotein dehydrogenase-associated putative ABC transporter substrate-binding protein [Gemmatimonadales bacterium]